MVICKTYENETTIISFKKKLDSNYYRVFHTVIIVFLKYLNISLLYSIFYVRVNLSQMLFDKYNKDTQLKPGYMITIILKGFSNT